LEFGRGRLTTSSNRLKVVEIINTAICDGARQCKACQAVGISERTYQRWKSQGIATRDKRPDAIRPMPKNKLTHEEDNHRGHGIAPTNRNITTHSATGPNQVWMWDITWIAGPAKVIYYYLYMIIDLFSRKVINCKIK